MVCLGLKPGAAGWKAQTNPLSYGGTPSKIIVATSFEWLPKVQKIAKSGHTGQNVH